MKKLTTNQKQIIEQITLEFQRINQESVPNKKYNLLDVAPLLEQNRLKAEFINDAKADNERWDKIANDEAKRIVDLLQKDLSMYSVQKYDHSNGHFDLPIVLIRNNEKGSTHHEDCVIFNVCVKEEYKSFEDIRESFGIGLYYKFRGQLFNTIEELLGDETFKRQLKDKVIY